MAWPTTSNPRTEFVMVRMTVQESEDLDRLAADSGKSRSEAMREAISKAVDEAGIGHKKSQQPKKPQKQSKGKK